MEENQEPKKRNAIGRAVDTVKERVSRASIAASNDLQQMALEAFMPHIKGMIPGVVTHLDDFLSGKNDNGKSKLVLMKRNKITGKIQILIVNEEIALLTNQDGTDPQELILQNIPVDKYVELFLSGKLDDATKNAGF